MRCPSCGADNPADAARCAGCGTKLARRPRRRGVPSESNTPFASGPDSRDPTALTAYRLSVVGLVPFLGLVFGPLGLVLGLIAWRKERSQGGPAVAAVILGSLAALTNWAGLILMLVGLHSRS
ncbi:MAG TPA: zinc ribbon domain-containing protein [Gemmataceae bacterium]|nr:zinc ribbon domain-containing protein [Gemmataceae bacterium]